MALISHIALFSFSFSFFIMPPQTGGDYGRCVLKSWSLSEIEERKEERKKEMVDPSEKNNNRNVEFHFSIN